MMRQANFPDQKAHTARDENKFQTKPAESGWFLVTVGTSASLSSLKSKHWAASSHFPQPSLTGPILAPSPLLWSMWRRQLSSSSECHLPMQRPRVDSPESHLPHVPTRWPQLCTSRLLPEWSGQTPIEPISSGPNGFLARLPSPLDNSNAALLWDMRGCAGSQASSLRALSPLQCEAGLGLPGSCSLIPHPHLLGSYIFLFIFKWQVFYPTINKIKYILYIGENRATFLQEKQAWGAWHCRCLHDQSHQECSGVKFSTIFFFLHFALNL